MSEVQSKSGKLAEDWLKKLFAKGLFNEKYTTELFGAHIIELANIIDSHAAEARAEQAEKCADATKSEFELYGPLITFPIVMQACLNAVEKSDE